ncbi:transcription termination factor MTERF8, chloroplastic-like [Carex rostrata]
MCSHLVFKRAIYYSFFSPPQCHCQYLLRFPLSTKTQPKELPFIADYLISSFGFSLNRALKASADSHLTTIKSPAQPEAMVKFLTDTGLSHSQIKSVVSLQPALLGYNADEILRSKVREMMEKGIPGEVLVQLFRYNPVVLQLQDTLARLLFWRDFVENKDKVLLKVISRNPFLISLHIENHILPRLNLLKEYGLSNNRHMVACLVTNYGLTNKHMVWVIGHCNLDHLRQILDLVEELGIRRGSKKFLSGLIAIANLSICKIKSNVEFFKNTYGWSQEEVCAAFRKYPLVLRLSEEHVRSTMNFLMSKVGIEARNIALRPLLLGCSIEKLIPRYNVLNTLKSKGLKKRCRLQLACLASEKRFREKYVMPFEKQVPGLSEAYEADVAAFGGKVPVSRNRP